MSATMMSSRFGKVDVAPASTVKALRPVSVARRAVASAATCSAQKQEASRLPQALAAAALAACVTFSTVNAAQADIAGLTPCSESKAFAKRQKNEIKGLTKRLKQYEVGSAPSLALQATIDRTEKRFASYGAAGLLCGTDGLPHLISDPGLALRYGHAGETLLPTIAFLYIAGYIGYVGRDYLQIVKADKKPTEKEIIIDVPLAVSLSLKGAGWPFRAVRELQKGTLTENDANITVSPR